MGIPQVCFGCSNDRFGGNGSILSIHELNRGYYHSYNIIGGILKDQAIEIFQKFYLSENRRAPEGKRKIRKKTNCDHNKNVEEEKEYGSNEKNDSVLYDSLL